MSATDRYGVARRLGLGVVSLLALACGGRGIESLFVGYTPHEQYERSLREVGLDQTALGREWVAAAAGALDEPLAVRAPYHEVSYLDDREATASGYRLQLRRGQHVAATFELDSDSSTRVFLDMFVIPTGSSEEPVLLRSADSAAKEIEFVARRDGDYLLRIQPELLRGGRYEITIKVGASLAFPVQGHDTTAIKSWWGDSRSGGQRSHQGVDIFAPRNTPVIAAANAVVRSTRPNRLGGNVVWLRDELGRSLYYAHLERHAVQRGDEVRIGDTVGFVGNSGNARTTPPHLHFGVYERGFGPSDPYPALYQPPTETRPFSGELALIGGLARAMRPRTRVRTAPSRRSSVLAELSVNTPLSVLAGTGDWYRVRLPDGSAGYVEVTLAGPADRPIRSTVVAGAAVLRRGPDSMAPPLETLEPGEEVPVLGEFGEFLYVQSPRGRSGWLELD